MLIKHCQQLFLNLNLAQYWISRASQMSLLFMFGATLNGSGYELQSVFFLWMLLYCVQSFFLWGTHLLPDTLKFNAIRLLSLFSLLLSLYLLFNSFNAYLYIFILGSLQPAFREVIHEAIIYVREKRDWSLGVDVASAFMNEGGKALGGLFIALIGFLSDLGHTYLMSFIVFCIVFCGFYFLRFDNNDSNNIKVTIDSESRSMLIISCLHNSLFFGIQFFLSLALLDVLKNAGFDQNALSYLGVILSTVMISGLVINNIIKQRMGYSVNKTQTCVLLWQSLMVMTGICFFMASCHLIYYNHWMSHFMLAMLIGVGIGSLQSVGSFFSIGLFQFLDIHYSPYSASERKQRRKHFMNLNMILSNVTPGITLGLLAASFFIFLTLERLTMPILLFIAVGELFLTIAAYHLTSKKRPQIIDF